MAETPEKFRMTPGHLDHAVKMLAGEIHALNMVVQILVKTHPNLVELLAQLNQVEPRGLAYLENLPLKDEALIEGYQFVMASVQKALSSRAPDQA